MSIPRSNLRSLLPDLSAALKSFQKSSSKFQIIRSITPPSPTEPTHPKTLFILDSSFNPPSRAHLTLAKSALHANATKHHPAPYRLLLLFSTHNADKAPSAASFDQRLALMTIFAEDLLASLTFSNQSSHTYAVPIIDIGLTTAPYYSDKSAAIAAEATSVYPDSPRHVHLLGFDTLTRFFAPKYYKDFEPPLSALNGFFGAGHSLRVTMRPSEEYGSIEEQARFLQSLEKGEMEKDGGKRQWAEQIEMVEAASGVGVSSTKVRKAAKARRWEEVEELCTGGIANAVRDGNVYDDDDRGSKMA